MAEDRRDLPTVTVDERLFRGLSVYQDVIVAGQTVQAGHRDCADRWALIEPHLPAAGAFLDVGSNFGWFGLQIVTSRPDAVVASVEADERSAAVQYLVLRSNDAHRICLLTQRAGAPLARRFAAAGQRFAGMLCLSVLHWMPDHREFLEIMGGLSERLFIELPDPQESGAGVAALCRAIGVPEEYLARLFPDRPRNCLGRLPSHRDPRCLRELWMVGPTAHDVQAPGSPAALDAEALLNLSPGWPPRSWWMRAIEALPSGGASAAGAVHFTRQALQPAAQSVSAKRLNQLRHAARRVTEQRAIPVAHAWYRRIRRSVGNVLRSLLRGVPQ